MHAVEENWENIHDSHCDEELIFLRYSLSKNIDALLWFV